MILAFDTSTAACTAALFDGSGVCLGRRDEIIGRGHAERLVPMIAELLDGRSATRILVGVGPGSFTGLRVGIAAAHGLAIGWDAELSGFSSLALIATGVDGAEPVAAAMHGGHGELFVQQFDGDPRRAASDLFNLDPAAAAAQIDSEMVAGPGAADLVAARGHGRAIAGWPCAADALKLADDLRALPAKPLYGRAPDARALAIA